MLILKVIQAKDLKAADVMTRKSDPFCVIEIVNNYLQTHTVQKNLDPIWNRVFFIPLDDVTNSITISVFDEDRDRTSSDFLGRLTMPIFNLQNCPRRWFTLKSKNLSATSNRGYIELEGRVIYNQVRAVARAIDPKEETCEPPESKIRMSTIRDLQRDINRIKLFVGQLTVASDIAHDCIYWKNPVKSILAIVFWIFLVTYAELWMAPFGLFFLFLATYILNSNGWIAREPLEKVGKVSEEIPEDDERLSPMEKFTKVQEYALKAQRVLDQVASTLERIKK